MSEPQGYLSKLRKYNFSVLLVAIILFLLVPPIFEGTKWEGLLAHAALTIVLVASVWVIFGVKKHPAQPIIAGVAVILLNWVAFFETTSNTANAVRLLAFFAFWTFTTFHILKNINAQKIVSPEVISGAVSGYLLFGLLGGLMAACLELIVSGSFNINNPDELSGYVYYSFVTLSTLGYGDILPKNNLAQTLAIAISLTGQIYLTVVIAILVLAVTSESFPPAPRSYRI